MNDNDAARAGYAQPDGGTVMKDSDAASTGYAQLDDSALLAIRREVREQLEYEPANMADLVRAHYLLTTEVVRRTVALRKRTNEGA
jgi:hypothetical protein